MENAYVPAKDVTSPRRRWVLVQVIYDEAKIESAALAVGIWDQRHVLAMRWNGNSENPLGVPQSRGLPVWFVVPDAFRQPILASLKLSAAHKALVDTFFGEA